MVGSSVAVDTEGLVAVGRESNFVPQLIEYAPVAFKPTSPASTTKTFIHLLSVTNEMTSASIKTSTRWPD
jgi:hypothetical protein